MARRNIKVIDIAAKAELPEMIATDKRDAWIGWAEQNVSTSTVCRHLLHLD